MRELSPSPEVKLLLDRYKAWYGPVEHVLIAPEDEAPDREAVHRAAAIFTLNALARRWEAYADESAEREGYDRANYGKFEIGPLEGRGTPISIETFLGPAFDRDQGVLRETWERPVPEPEFVRIGYADAFAHPPHPMWVPSPEAVSELFVAIAEHLFNGFRGGLTIYRWPTDWSNYFEEGHEWWGSFCWTVYNHESRTMIGVVASTTD